MLRYCLLELAAVCLALCAPIPALAAAGAIRVVAAENFYGDIAAQLAGPAAQVTSVLHNPDADPHLFEVDIATARAVAAADLVIYNGLGYDTWMSRLLESLDPARRVVVEAAAASRAASGSNPHLWYDPRAIRSLAAAVASALERIDPAHRSDYAERLARFTASLRPLDEEIARLRARDAGAAVAATEPVADYLVAALGLDMRERRFQLAVENGTEPSAADTAAFQNALRRREVRVLIYNPQASSTAVERLLGIAREARVPIVGMTETEPRGLDYQQWMLGELRALGRALGVAAR
ncbi:MAG: metal ABC transporter solute-binding protein, Zn/Mn family [Steroidobacteraceae bacterium]